MHKMALVYFIGEEFDSYSEVDISDTHFCFHLKYSDAVGKEARVPIVVRIMALFLILLLYSKYRTNQYP